MSKGQRDDFLAYMATGTSAIWALGGLPGLLAASVVGACGVGAIVNQKPTAASTVDVDDRVENQLRAEYGEAAIQTYRASRMTGVPSQIAARNAIYKELQKRKT